MGGECQRRSDLKKNAVEEKWGERKAQLSVDRMDVVRAVVEEEWRKSEGREARD